MAARVAIVCTAVLGDDLAVIHEIARVRDAQVVQLEAARSVEMLPLLAHGAVVVVAGLMAIAFGIGYLVGKILL